MVQGQEKSIRFSHETYLQHCSPQRKNTEEEEESAEKLKKEQPQGLEIDIPLVEIQCYCHLLSPTLKKRFFFPIYFFFIYFKTDVASHLLFGNLLGDFKISQESIPTYTFKLFNKHVFWHFGSFCSFLNSYFKNKAPVMC